MRPIGYSLLVAAASVFLQDTPETSPLTRAHAHNDYEHKRPLLDALDQGFCSIEVDVWLVDGKLLVAHDLKDVKPEHTLESLYLEPLRARIRQNTGRVFRNGPSVTLLVDIKSEPESTYAKLKDVLHGFREMLTRWDPEEKTGAVTVIVSGNRPVTTMAAESTRPAAVDGRISDLKNNPPATLMPLVSDNWRNNFSWRGIGPMPIGERDKLHALVKKCREQNRRFRFWATPEFPTVWTELVAAGVDLISTDDLVALSTFLRAEAPVSARARIRYPSADLSALQPIRL